MAVLNFGNVLLAGERGRIELEIEDVSSPLGENGGMLWLTSQCAFRFGPISGRFQLSLTYSDLESMRDGLALLLTGRDGVEASFATLEEDLMLHFAVLKRGMIAIDGRINPHEWSEVSCAFAFEAGPMDLQRSMTGLIDVLRQIELRVF